MLTRSSVLGKRGHQVSSSPAPAMQACEQLQTPDSTPNPKRARTTTSVEDGDGNKENIPPFKLTPIDATTSPRSARALRRTSTSSAIMTPTRSRPSPRRVASVSSLVPATPSADIIQVAISTPPPTPPTILLPIETRIRALLRSTCNNTQTEMAGREAERTSILEFLSSFIEGNSMVEDKAASSMFISGSPGTGKTALVNSIIRQLSSSNDTDVKVVSINCMALKSVDALWERMIEELTTGPKRKVAGKKLKGRETVQSLLATLKVKYVLILDELDNIASSTQSLSSIFTLTESLPDALRLIGIANTHTLTSSSTAFSPSSNVRTIHFAPYTPAQLQAILQSRLDSLSAGDAPPQTATDVKRLIPTPALVLLTKKVAALTGDVRSLFEVLRGAIDLAVVPKESNENPLHVKPTIVTPQHILAALKAYTPSSPSKSSASSTPSSTPTAATSSSETFNKINNLGLQARLALVSILLASKRVEAGLSLSASTSPSASPKKSTASPMKRSTSLPNPATNRQAVGIETGVLHSYYTGLLSRTEMGLFEPVSRSEFGDLMGVLEGNGIVSLSSSLLACTSPKGKKPFGRSASFGAGLGKSGAGAIGEVRLVEGMWGDEVLRGLGVTSEVVVDAREEEVRGIWQREQARLRRDLKAAANAASNSNLDLVAGAFQL
ncbi:P-loop containing nucleoside triphosphate hydrolase protein [Pholiota conissans]|uniref:P-loop containing nucleoside triphosphate hydrolase protein n=1 Tax=Pholiota conissans TaxID=109636 RepID=A0A9P5Z6Z4_9AGAR|nr:P-loop containing nucleoside triphosphate hydrolase protein [Pholiota conissans]